jgi:SAM-dependent methyltransferase
VNWEEDSTVTIPDEELARTQQSIWNNLVGRAWVRHAGVHDRQAAPFGQAAMDALGSITGATILDVGCGTGAASAELVDRGAREVLGIDLSAPMIDAARATNTRSELRFELGDVLELRDFDHFDVVFSRFGVMFFDDPVPAFAHLRALGTARGRLGFCCWGPPADNPWMTLPVMATVPVLGPPHLAAPGEPGPFSLPSPDVVRGVLSGAGWVDVKVDRLTTDQLHPAGDAAAVADIVIEFSPPIAESLLHAPERTDDTRSAIADALRPLEREGIVHLQASALIVTAHA